MTRKHFQALADCAAEIISNLNNPTDWDEQLVIREISAVCRQYNSNFDSQRFSDWVAKRLEAVDAQG